MNKFFILLILSSLPLFGWSQTNFKLKADVPSPGWTLPNRLYKVTECADGGFAIAGVMNFNGSWASHAQVIIKFDYTGTVEWFINMGQVEDFDATQLIATADSGFYCLFHSYDIMFAQFTSPALYKLDKYGNVQHAVGFGPNANYISISEVEKYSEILHISGTHYEYDPIEDEPCCYSGYAVKLNPDLTVNSHDLSRISSLIIYDSLNVPQLVRVLPTSNNVSSYSFSIYDTTGIAYQAMEYFHDSLIFSNFNINAILQHGGNYYVTGIVTTLLNSSFAIHKLDSNYNTVYFKILDGSAQIINPAQLQMCKSAISPSGNILLSTLINIGSLNFNSLMAEADTAGNVVFASSGNDPTYFDADIGSVSENFYFAHKLNSFNYMPVIERTSSLSSSCDFTPLNFVPLNVIITDSLFPGIDLLPMPMMYPTISAFTSTPVVSLVPVVTDLCNTTNLEISDALCEITVSPNPASGHIKITSCELQRIKSIEIRNTLGSTIVSLNCNKFDLEYFISTQGLPGGIYFISGTLLNEKSFFTKIIILDK